MGVFVAQLEAFLGSGQLAQQHGRLELVHAVFGAGHFGAAPLRGAVVLHGVAFVHQLFVIADDRAAFSAGNCLARLEAEAAQVTNGAQLFPAIHGQMCLAGIFDHLELVLLGDLHDAVHIAGLAHHVHGHDGLGVFGDPFFHVVGVDLIRLRVQVGQHRQGPGGQDRGDCAGVGIGRGDDLVARPASTEVCNDWVPEPVHTQILAPSMAANFRSKLATVPFVRF